MFGSTCFGLTTVSILLALVANTAAVKVEHWPMAALVICDSVAPGPPKCTKNCRHFIVEQDTCWGNSTDGFWRFHCTTLPKCFTYKLTQKSCNSTHETAHGTDACEFCGRSSMSRCTGNTIVKYDKCDDLCQNCQKTVFRGVLNGCTPIDPLKQAFVTIGQSYAPCDVFRAGYSHDAHCRDERFFIEHTQKCFKSHFTDHDISLQCLTASRAKEIGAEPLHHMPPHALASLRYKILGQN